jgi:hypothetical protein
MNIPSYPHPYGVAPQLWGYGHHANAATGLLNRGGFPDAGGLPNVGGIPNGGRFPNTGGIPNTGGVPNPVPQLIVERSDEVQVAVTGTRNQTGRERAVPPPPARTYPNEQVKEGGMLHLAKQELTSDTPKFGCLRL